MELLEPFDIRDRENVCRHVVYAKGAGRHDALTDAAVIDPQDGVVTLQRIYLRPPSFANDSCSLHEDNRRT